MFRHSWLWEQFEDRPDYIRKSMFGCQAIYLHGRMMFCVAAKQDPWAGLLCITAREHHASLCAEFPYLTPHAVLGKWLYLSDSDDHFESRAQDLLELIGRGDRRLGVVPQPRRRSSKAKRSAPAD